MVKSCSFENLERDYLELKWLKDEVSKYGLFKGKKVYYWMFAISSDYVTEKGPAMVVLAGTEDSTIIHMPKYLNNGQAEVILEIFSREIKNKDEKIITLTKRDYKFVKESPYYKKFEVQLVNRP